MIGVVQHMIGFIALSPCSSQNIAAGMSTAGIRAARMRDDTEKQARFYDLSTLDTAMFNVLRVKIFTRNSLTCHLSWRGSISALMQ